MAESAGNDSVGKIKLEVEVASDLSNQIGKVSNAIGKKLKDTMNDATKTMFNGMNESMDKNMQSMNSSLKSGLDKMKQNIRSTFTSALDVLKNIKMPSMSFPKIDIAKPNTSNPVSQPTTRGPPTSNINSEAIKAQMDNVSRTLDNTNAKIEQQQAKLAGLKESYNNTFNDNRKNAIQEKILKTESAINSLISKSDKLGFKLADLDAQFASAGVGAGEAASKLNLLSKSTGIFESLASGTANVTKKLNESLKSLGSTSNSTNNHMNNMHGGLSNIAKQFFTWMVVLPLVMKGLSSMTSFLGGALMTNSQFANSLNQIKSNLYTAFMPIYNAILPALNSLMSSLATATAYMASFISQLFGSTYEASFGAAKNLQTSIGAYNQQEKAAKKAATALGGAGSAAKKAANDAKGLAGFDEINKLSDKTPTPAGSGVETPITPMANMAPIEAKTAEWVQKFKDIMSKIFDPTKEAWANEGKATMDALKYALGSIWDLAKDIGKTFLDVWDNGTGVRVCTDILKLLQTMFNIIGDIATAFKTAWDKGDLGKQVVQALFNALDAVLQLLNTIGTTFRDVWNSGLGVEICTNILEILKNIFTIIGQIATSFKTAWDSGLGKQLVTDILNLLNGCLRVIKDITASFSKAWVTNGDTICSAILLILDNIVGTISDIANKWANAWENNGAGDKLMDSLLSTLGKILTTIGDIGQGIRESIGKAADTIFPAMIQFATDVSTGLGNLADGFKSIWDNGGQHLFYGIVNLIAKVGELILKITGGAFKDASGIFKDILAPAIGTVFDVAETLIDKLAEFTDWINNNKTLIDILSAALVGIGTALAGAKIASLLGEAVGALKIFGSAMKFVFSEGIISGIVDLGGALVVAVGGWPIIIGAAIIAIGVLIYTHWDEIKAKTAEIWNGIKDFFSQWGTDILALITGGPIALVGVEIAKHWDEISAKTSEIWNNITAFLGEKWENLKTWAAEKFNAIKETISTKWDEIKASAGEKWDNIKTYLGEKWDAIKNFIPTKWDEFKKAISDKWDEIKTDVGTKWEEIKTSLYGKWEDIKNFIPTKWGEFKQTISDKWNEIMTDTKGIWDGLVAWFNSTFSVDWGNAWNNLVQNFGKIWDGLKGLAKAPINAVIGWINALISSVNTAIRALNKIHVDIPDWIPGIGGENWSVSLDTIDSIPKLATGGIIDSPTLAMVGEAGKEAVMPLENNTGWITELAGKIAGMLGVNNSAVSTSNESGDIIFMLDGNILGKVALSQLRKMKKQGLVLSDVF